jgi:hypothetical protein
VRPGGVVASSHGGISGFQSGSPVVTSEEEAEEEEEGEEEEFHPWARGP